MDSNQWVINGNHSKPVDQQPWSGLCKNSEGWVKIRNEQKNNNIPLNIYKKKKKKIGSIFK